MIKYRMFGGSGVAPEERISKDLVKVIEMANESLASPYRYKDKTFVSIPLSDINKAVGANNARPVIVEAIRKADKIMVDACGSSWLMFFSVVFDSCRPSLNLHYRPNAASVIKAVLTLEGNE